MNFLINLSLYDFFTKKQKKCILNRLKPVERFKFIIKV